MKLIIRNKGGFGNQLFIYAFYLFLKNKFPEHNIVIENISGFLRNKFVYWHIQTNRPLLNKYFKIKRSNIIDTLKVYFSKINSSSNFLKVNYLLGDTINWEEADFSCDSIIEGYYQNYFLFKEELLLVKDQLNKIIFDKYDRIENGLAIQIRANDYNYKIDLNYIKNAITKFDSITKNKIYIYSDNLNWCKKNLDFIKNKVFINSGDDINDLFLLSRHVNIILTIGTYGWWGAFLGEKNKRVIYPKNKTHSNKFYPKEWKSL